MPNKVIIFILIFTGCTPSYTLKPNYDKNTNILMIDDYVIKKATKIIDKKRINVNALAYEYKKFNVDDVICKNIAYSHSDIRNSNMHYFTSAIEDIQSRYKNQCSIEKINNLSFFKCPANFETTLNNESNYETAYHYGITNSYGKDSGYGLKTTVYLGNKALCFVNIRDYFLNKSKSKRFELLV